MLDINIPNYDLIINCVNDIAGEISQEEIEIRFIDSFSNGFATEPGRVSYVEFEEYYEGLSIIIVSDNDFVNMMRNCWGV